MAGLPACFSLLCLVGLLFVFQLRNEEGDV
jgi:hypothetical protein